MYLDSSDALSQILTSLGLQVDVYAHREVCGHWAIDTSGSKKMPFHLVAHGRAWLHLDSDKSNPILLSAGDLVLFPRDVEHVITSEAEQPDVALLKETEEQAFCEVDPDSQSTTLICGAFEFTSKGAWPLLDALPESVIIDLSQQSQNPQLRKLIELLIMELESRHTGCFAAVSHIAHLIFIDVLRTQMSNELSSGLLAALADPHIGKALNLIHSSPEKPWTIESLASEVAMSRSVFASLFKEKTEMTPIKYLTDWRMREACELLRNTQKGIFDIAESLGYSSEAAFRKAFKASTGCSPAQYRKRECTASM